jgi:hypothetical protein
MTPLEAAWEEFKKTASYVAYDWETDREPFDGGFKAGIKYALSQIEWDIQNRATDNG